MVVRRTKLACAKMLRQHPTQAEAEAWNLLRNRRILGLKFRRQKPLFGFIVDFYCAEHRLVIEIDGQIHDTPEIQAADQERTSLLEGRGFTVIRIPNRRVTEDEITRKIQRAVCALRSGPPSPVSGEGVRG